MEFKCFDCGIVFEGEGRKLEYTDPMYGPCSKIVASCPVCSGDSSEYRKPKQGRSSREPENSCPAYHSGSCSCCH